jgi:Rad3-related DNA helicase
MSDILNFWPIPEFQPRPNQVAALEWLAEQDAKYCFLQAPVGAGKSLIGATFAGYRKAMQGNTHGSYILTPQRILQEQYEKTFPRHIAASLYGKGNYQCAKCDSTCDVGSVLDKKCGSCPYDIAKTAAKAAENVILNYKIAFLMFRYTNVWATRPLMVLDECHVAEDHLTELDAATIHEKRAEKYGVKWRTFDDMFLARNWIRDEYLPKAQDHYDDLYESLKHIVEAGDSPSSSDVRKLKEMSGLGEHLDSVGEVVYLPDDQLQDVFVLVKDKVTMKFKRLSGGPIFHEIVKPQADKFLFMSSTILNYKGFCNDLSIDPEDAVYLDLNSEFDPENRPVYFMPQMKMNASWKADENAGKRERMLRRIIDICKMYDEDGVTQSGIIHSGNFQVAQWLVENLEGKIPQEIWHHNPDSGRDRNDIINGFQRDQLPGILISPSITEGLDLKDDLSRFAIFVKIPFGFLGDQWIKRRMEMSQEWYQRRALIDVIQGAGRVVRSKEDWGHTFILDASWAYLYKSTSRHIPDWWKDGYLVAD